MKIINISAIFVTSFLISPYAYSIPDPSPDPDASIVYLRTSCDIANADVGESPVENCFEDTNSLQSWIYSRADQSAKLSIEVGPGIFSGFSCNSSQPAGNLSFSGSGTGKTTFESLFSGVSHDRCGNANWSFKDMTIKGIYAVVWFGGGQSRWNNVDFIGGNAAWYDAVGNTGNKCPLGQQGTHRFFSSRLTATQSGGGFAFLNACGDNWFWGSEILFTPSVNAGGGAAIISKGAGNQMHFYGSNIRAELNPAATSATGTLTAISVDDAASVHSHGVGIDVVAKPGWTISSLSASNGGQIHANAVSYVLQPSTGANIQRLVNNGGTISAPFQWTPAPTVPNITSIDGADTGVLTSGTSDNQPHMIIYSSGCASNWYDMVDKACTP